MSGVQQAGRYRMVRRIGLGGMAEVFEGEALGEGGFRRRVAIKRLLAANAADESFRRMFLDEARIASQLHHAGIVAILDYGISEGLPFQVLEYVDGPSCLGLRELALAAGQPFPVEIALAICTEIAHALDHAHHAVDHDGRPLGIVHRDVSPGNVLVAWSGDVKLGDFGIAFARGRVVTTSAGVARGTLAYMAPEQVLRGELDGRTDVFGLGCVLAALCAGESPLQREGAMADLVAGGELVLPALPDDVRALVARATRLARRDRWDSAAALAAALGGALARRVDRDGKSLLREFLARVRPAAPKPAPRRGLLDAALDLELVLASTANQVREFEARRRHSVSAGSRGEPRAARARAVPTPSAARVRQSAQLEAVAPPTRRPTVKLEALAPETHEAVAAPPVARWRWPLIALLLLGVGALAWWLIPREVALALAPPPLPDAAIVVVAPPDAAVVVVAPPPDAAVVAEPPRRRRVEPPPPEVEPAPPLAVTSGTVQIGGEGALRAEILVDGHSRGFAPKTLELKLGPHQVELIGTKGVVASKRLVVEARHTTSAPLRWIVP